jgi:hypothetical protein
MVGHSCYKFQFRIFHNWVRPSKHRRNRTAHSRISLPNHTRNRMKKLLNTAYEFFVAWAEVWNQYKNVRHNYY